MPAPSRLPAGQMVDSTWASASDHPCHSLAGHIKGLILIPTSGAPYDAAALNLLTVDAAPNLSGFTGRVLNGSTPNALKDVLEDFTLLAGGVVVSQGPGGCLAGYVTDEPNGHPLTGILGSVNQQGGYNVNMTGRTYNSSSDTSDCVETNLDYSSRTQTLTLYAASFLAGGTTLGLIESGTLRTGTWMPPGSTNASETLVQAEAHCQWNFGSIPVSPPDTRFAQEVRAEYIVVFDAPATEAQMNYLFANPTEMLMTMTTPPPAGGGTTGGGTTGTDPQYVPGVATREIYSLLPSGSLLRDTSGVIVPDAAFTLTQFTDCDMNVISSTLPPGTNLSTADSAILQVNSMGYGAYCVEYDVQTCGEAHLIVMPVKEGHLFDNVQILLKYSVSTNDLDNIEASCVDALNSANSVLAGVTQIGAVAALLNSMIQLAGGIPQLRADALAQAISQLQPSAAAALAAALPANITTLVIDNAGHVTAANPADIVHVGP